MSQSLIVLLSSKPIVRPPKEIEVKISREVPQAEQAQAEQAQATALIVDKRADKKVDRQAILNTIKGVKAKQALPIATEKDLISLNYIKDVKDCD